VLPVPGATYSFTKNVASHERESVQRLAKIVKYKNAYLCKVRLQKLSKKIFSNTPIQNKMYIFLTSFYNVSWAWPIGYERKRKKAFVQTERHIEQTDKVLGYRLYSARGQGARIPYKPPNCDAVANPTKLATNRNTTSMPYDSNPKDTTMKSQQ